jgi:hypothetical protein
MSLPTIAPALPCLRSHAGEAEPLLASPKDSQNFIVTYKVLAYAGLCWALSFRQRVSIANWLRLFVTVLVVMLYPPLSEMTVKRGYYSHKKAAAKVTQMLVRAWCLDPDNR